MRLRERRGARGAERQADQEDREHQAERVGAVADEEREQVGLDDLRREDEEARGEREAEEQRRARRALGSLGGTCPGSGLELGLGLG